MKTEQHGKVFEYEDTADLERQLKAHRASIQKEFIKTLLGVVDKPSELAVDPVKSTEEAKKSDTTEKSDVNTEVVDNTPTDPVVEATPEVVATSEPVVTETTEVVEQVVAPVVEKEAPKATSTGKRNR